MQVAPETEKLYEAVYMLAIEHQEVTSHYADGRMDCHCKQPGLPGPPTGTLDRDKQPGPSTGTSAPGGSTEHPGNLQGGPGEGTVVVKSRTTLRGTWSKRQAGAMMPVRRAGWVWAASCSPAAKSCVG